MRFSAEEIAKAKELKKLLKDWQPQAGHYIWARECPEGCTTIDENVFLIQTPSEKLKEFGHWLPSFDDLLAEAKKRKISFSQITDYLHRRRFADLNEREGLMQLFIEQLRSTTK